MYLREPKALARVKDPAVKKRFVSKLLVVGPGSVKGCWLWTGSRDSQGYGKFRLNGNAVPAHRAAYAIYIGDIPEGMTVHHEYTPPGHDGPLVHDVNPANLSLCSVGDNCGESNSRNGFRGAVKAGLIQKADSGDIETFECDRCKGTMVKGQSRYVCLNCDRVLHQSEVREIENAAV